jgi:hypothetical protein
LLTVLREIPRPSATCPLLALSAHANTILDRSANACAVVRRRAQPCNTWRSLSVSTTGNGFGEDFTNPFACLRVGQPHPAPAQEAGRVARSIGPRYAKPP